MNERSEPVALPSNANDDTWENNAKYLLERCPHTVRVREGGGPENLMHSFIHTFMAMEQKLRGSHETGERLNRLQLERLALQAINSLPCPDAEPLAKALDDQFERVTGYRTKNWPHGAETMRLERARAQKASDECCCAERGGGLVCTLPKGHAGQHEAWGARKNLLQSWPAMKADPPRGAKARDFVEYDPYGGVRVDMARYLRSPAGQAQLQALGGKKASERQPCSHGNATGHCQHCLDAL